ncbi:MAG: GAF domain-containing protein, partial [Anaerolineales bacterium]
PFLSAVAAQLSGWTIAILALLPIGAIALRWLSPLPRETTQGIRQWGDVWRAAFDVRYALEESESRVQSLNRRLRLLTGIRREIVRADSERQLIELVCRRLVASELFDGCWVGMLDQRRSGFKVVAQAGARWLPKDTEEPIWDGVAEFEFIGGSESAITDQQVQRWIEGHRLHQMALKRQQSRWDFYSLRAEDGLLGALVVYMGPDVDDLEHGSMLQGVAEDLALGISRLNLQKQREQRVRELNSLRDIMAEMLSEHSVQALLEMVVGRTVELLQANHSEIYILPQGSDRLERIARDGETPQAMDEGDSADIALRVVQQGSSLLLSPGSNLEQLPKRMATIASPLRSKGQVMGAICVHRSSQRPFLRRHLEVLDLLAHQTSIAIENARLIERERQRSAELETLRQASLSLTSSLDLQTVLEAILEQALKMLSAFDAHIFMYDGERLRFGAALWAGDVQREPYSEPRQDGLTATVARSGERIVVEDASHHPLFNQAKWDWSGAIIGIPLQVGGRVLGVMNIAFDAPRTFADEELHVLGLLADQAAVVLENARLFDRTAAERRRLRLLYDVSRELAGLLDPDEIMQRAIDITTSHLGGLIGAVCMVDRERDRLELVALAGLPLSRIESINGMIDMRVGKGLIGWAAEAGESAALDDVHSDPRWMPVPGLDDDASSAVVAPVFVENDLDAVLSVFHEEIGFFDDEHMELLSAICQQVGLAWSNARRYQQVERRLAERTALQQVAQVINSRLEMEPLLEEIVYQVSSVLGYPVVDITLIEGDQLVMRARQGPNNIELVRMPLERGVIGRVVRTGLPEYVPDVTVDPDYIADEPGSACEIAVPLHMGGVVVGALNVEALEPGGLTEDDLRLLTLLADQLSVAIENAALYDRLRQHTQDLEAVVTERTSELRAALAKAREADRLKTQFVSDVSHELRTPLSNIRLYVELLAGADTGRWDEYLATLGRETERLVALIEDLLSISRLDADSVPTHFQELDLNEVTRSLVEDRRRLFSENDLDLTWVPSDGPAMVWADEQLLSQVIANLMTNAMHYTPAGGQVAVSIERTADEGGARLGVQDTGLGIPAAEQPQLFTRFFRGSASRKMGNPGTGLGLAICFEIVQRHGGRISVESEEGVGSRFEIWLPSNGKDRPTTVEPVDVNYGYSTDSA